MIEAGWDGNAWKERPRKHKFLLGSVSHFFFFFFQGSTLWVTAVAGVLERQIHPEGTWVRLQNTCETMSECGPRSLMFTPYPQNPMK